MREPDGKGMQRNWPAGHGAAGPKFGPSRIAIAPSLDFI